MGEANANKVQSGYKKEKFNASRNKAKDNDSQKNNPPSSSERCKSCGGTPCIFVHPKSPHRKPEKYCLAKDKTCPICKKKGHNKGGCTEKTKSDAKSVKVRLVNVDKDDCEPTPTCNMEFKTEKGRTFSKEVLPDTGCSQTIVSENLTKTHRMLVNPKKKKQIWNASNERMLCRGTTTFEASCGDQTTEVLVLVSPDLNDDAVQALAVKIE